MSSPKRRIETDVMKMMMSDYEVTLVNDNMQEFYVSFKGPSESEHLAIPRISHIGESSNMHRSTVRRGPMESPRRTPRPVPLQIPVYRLRQQNLPPKY